MPLTYVLLPECGAVWDAMPLRGSVAVGRAMSRVIVAMRDRSIADLAGLDAFEPSMARAQIPMPWLADLAVALMVCGRLDEANDLLDGVSGVRLRVRLRELAKNTSKPVRAAAGTLLASQHVPPERAVRIEVLGPLRVASDGSVVLACAVQSPCRAGAPAGARRTRRGRTCARVLNCCGPTSTTRQPGTTCVSRSRTSRRRCSLIVKRTSRRTSSTIVAIRCTRERVRRSRSMSTSSTRRSGSVRSSSNAERPRRRWPSITGRLRCTAAITSHRSTTPSGRSPGDLDVATALALRSVEVDPWSEPVRRLLADARLASGDRSGAIRALDDCVRLLADLGIGPAPETRMPSRRIGFLAW